MIYQTFLSATKFETDKPHDRSVGTGNAQNETSLMPSLLPFLSLPLPSQIHLTLQMPVKYHEQN